MTTSPGFRRSRDRAGSLTRFRSSGTYRNRHTGADDGVQEASLPDDEPPQHSSGRRLDVIAFSRTPRLHLPSSSTPFPAGDLRHVLSVLGDVLFVLQQLVANRLFGIGGARSQLWQPIDHIPDEMEPIE